MANRYFRNTGDNRWNVATNWSLTDGGGSVGAVPTLSDDVFFTGNSGDCNINITANAKTITCTGYVNALAGTSQLTVSGNITLVSGMTLTYSGALVINAAATIILAGKTISSLRINYVSSTINGGNARVLNFTISQAGSTIQLSSNLVVDSLICAVSTAASHNIIKSNSSGVQRKLSIAGGDLSFVDFTDIDASGGGTIRTRKGIISNCKNIVLLIPPTQIGSIN